MESVFGRVLHGTWFCNIRLSAELKSHSGVIAVGDTYLCQSSRNTEKCDDTILDLNDPMRAPLQEETQAGARTSTSCAAKRGASTTAATPSSYSVS